jgi:serine/threonine protein kinase
MKIGNYQIISELGSGGMATVYLARHEGLDKTVAIKVLNKDLVHVENIRKRFLAEARYLARLKHANIVMVTDLIEENGMAAYVMKYIQGETLSEILRKNGKLPDEQIIDIFSQILDAVGYVHTENLIHRDIKPANIIITPEGKVKLMDFGIAKNTDPSSEEYTITHQDSKMGTVMYMSPEQVKSTKEVTYSTDIYSLGVVLWQMVTGVKPYDQSELSRPEIEVSILREKLPETNVASWDAVIQKATEKNPENRYKDCSEFLLEINRFAITNKIKEKNQVNFEKEQNQEVTLCEIPDLSDEPTFALDKEQGITVESNTKIQKPGGKNISKRKSESKSATKKLSEKKLNKSNKIELNHEENSDLIDELNKEDFIFQISIFKSNLISIDKENLISDYDNKSIDILDIDKYTNPKIIPSILVVLFLFLIPYSYFYCDKIISIGAFSSLHLDCEKSKTPIVLIFSSFFLFISFVLNLFRNIDIKRLTVTILGFYKQGPMN